ncbi:MAG: OB-fold nucleic acid binding domain-containing protein, partial [Rhodothermales bacterium]|nr:OB-fold nucleic acid binding domain-containing protein [Rhodothermales bacterium]
MASHVQIEELGRHVGETITLKGWLYNKRESKSLAFLVLRDGSGLVQCVVAADGVSDTEWEAALAATQETALEVTGMVRQDDRQVGGYEVQVTHFDIIADSDDYPITPKPHGVEFLMNHRHLWLRSRRQWAIMRVRNRVIMAIHGFFQERGFVQMDAPILTGNAVEGTS